MNYEKQAKELIDTFSYIELPYNIKIKYALNHLDSLIRLAKFTLKFHGVSGEAEGFLYSKIDQLNSIKLILKNNLKTK
jgi:hypothetical protein